MPGLVPGIHVLLFREKKDVDGRDKPGHDGLYLAVSHQHLAAGDGVRNDPPLEQIEIDIAASQDQAVPFSLDLCLLLQRGGKRRSAGALREVVGVGPVGADRGAHFIVGDLHDARGPLRMIASASGSGTPVAMPSASVSLLFVLTTVPAPNDSAYHTASLPCTPTLSLSSESSSP